MSWENVQIIRRMYDAWLAQDIDVVFETFDRDTELNPDKEAAWVGIGRVYRRHAGVRSYMASVYETFEGYRQRPGGQNDSDGSAVRLLAP
jgi:ketosteroid isomerase-like protein